MIIYQKMERNSLYKIGYKSLPLHTSVCQDCFSKIPYNATSTELLIQFGFFRKQLPPCATWSQAEFWICYRASKDLYFATKLYGSDSLVEEGKSCCKVAVWYWFSEWSLSIESDQLRYQFQTISYGFFFYRYTWWWSLEDKDESLGPLFRMISM